MTDLVNSPSHYKDHFPIEVIEVVKDMNYLWGNAFKYLTRARYKGTLRLDLQKCVKYLEWAGAYHGDVPHGGVPVSRFANVQGMLIEFYRAERHLWWATAYTNFRRGMLEPLGVRYLIDDINDLLEDDIEAALDSWKDLPVEVMTNER